MRIVTCKEMKQIESETFSTFANNESNIIEAVGIKGSAYLVSHVVNKFSHPEFIFLIGRGNNGADGLAIARQLFNQGYPSHCFLFYPESGPISPETTLQLKMAEAYGLKVIPVNELDTFTTFCQEISGELVVVDAIFGTGVKLPLSNDYYDLINDVNQNADYIVSIDIPTGLKGDSGQTEGNVIQANVTLAVGFPKQGYYQANGPKVVGEIAILEVGFPHKFYDQGDKFLIDYNHLPTPDIHRNRFGDKKLFGHVLVLGGSHGLTGALVLAAQAALKVGTGLVTGATWESQYNEFISRLMPEVMTGYIPENSEEWNHIIRDMNKYDAMVIGPGLARSELARRLVLEVLNNYTGPLVIDADAINVMNMDQDYNILALREAPTVLTPHAGEFARFAGADYKDVLQNPIENLRRVIEKINCSIVLKGACTYLAFPSGEILFNFSPNDGMATGGVGDVLAGILGGLLAQNAALKHSDALFNKYQEFNKSVLFAVQVHTLAGRFAAQKYGERPMTAGSIISCLTETFSSFANNVGLEREHGRKTYR